MDEEVTPSSLEGMLPVASDGDEETFLDKIYDRVSQLKIGKVIHAPHETAAEYLARYSNPDDSAESFIRWQCAKTGASGFALGLPGLIAMPITVPADLTALWYVQLRMVAVIASIYGHDYKDDRVRTLAYMSLLGSGAQEIFREVGVKIGNKVAAKALDKLPGHLLIKINKAIGFRLLTKAGSKGAVNLVKILPLAGGLVGGVMNVTGTLAVGKMAKTLLAPHEHRSIEVLGSDSEQA